ncbi:MAG: hypothetical protein AAB407_01165 [Patescibacteria group bacterium]
MKITLATIFTTVLTLGLVFVVLLWNNEKQSETPVVRVEETKKEIYSYIPQGKEFSLFFGNRNTEVNDPQKTVPENKYTTKIPKIDPNALLGPLIATNATDAEIFSIQHPLEYLSALNTLQNIMVEEGVLTVAEKKVFDNEDKVLGFWGGKTFEFLREKGIVTENDRPGFLQGIGIVRALHLQEAVILRGQASVPSNFELKNPLGIFTEFGSALAGAFVSEANAQTCFMSGDPTIPFGINLVAPCCACSVVGVPIGCLNLICLGRPAIFDQTTFICGCG